MRPLHLALCLAPCFLLGACREAGTGKLGSVSYEVDLPGSYTVVSRSEREDVWVPSDDDRPIVSIQRAPRPQRTGAPPTCADAGEDIVTSEGGFIFVREGDGIDSNRKVYGIDLKATTAPDGVAVHFSRCIPPGSEGVGCMANYVDGKMSPERKAAASAICKSLRLR